MLGKVDYYKNKVLDTTNWNVMIYKDDPDMEFKP